MPQIRSGTPSSFTRWPILGRLALTVAYTITGKLALMLAIAPGYASPIFPPAGIAAAAMLVAGRATLPWTFLGSFLLNLWTGYPGGHNFNKTGLAAAIVIAAASTLQAALAGFVLRRAVGYPAPLDNNCDVNRFLLLSPVCCLTSATVSLSGLWALGVVKAADLTANWISWSVGDTLGVLLLVPLVLVLGGEPRTLWSGRARTVALPMLLLAALFIAIFTRVSKWENDEALQEFRLVSQQIVDKIRTGLEEQNVFLEQLERSFSGRELQTRADFRHLVYSLLQRFPTIQAVKWAPRINNRQRSAFEVAQQADLAGFEIREVDASGKSRRAEDRPQFYPVTFVEPLKGNERIVGFDLASEAGRKAAIEETFRDGKVAATPPIRLVQEHHEQAGILLVFAVQDGPNGAGVVAIALRMGTFMTGLLAPTNSMINVQLVDLGRGQALFSELPVGPTHALHEEEFAFGGRRYRVQTVPTEAYLEQHRRWESWGVLVAGVVSTGLLGAWLLLGTGYTRRVETAVDDRTRQLEATNRRLQQEVKERQQAEVALRQAQRLEAIGQLTGGIAHDFNNLLTVVSGNATLLLDKSRDDTVRRHASAIERAAERGGRLTRELLTFSRRQTLRPECVDLRQRTREIVDMLSRSLREDIEVVVEMPEELWSVTVDLAEFELALLNIGVNARDAMPAGGRFGVVAKNVTCRSGDPASGGLVGDFVAVTMTDTGTGMAPEILARAFEPYFTTKEVGVGSGLGLAQVYGFAEQSGGAASIVSAVGKGTSMTLLLPCATALPAPRTAERELIQPVSAPAGLRT